MQAINLIVLADLSKGSLELGLASFIVGHGTLDINALSLIKGLSKSVEEEPCCGAKSSRCVSGGLARTAYCATFIEKPDTNCLGTVSATYIKA